jgi:hypothetical protein
MASPAQHTATKLVDEQWFVEGWAILSRDGVQVATIDEIVETWMERRTATDPETWEEVFGDEDFSSEQVLNDGDYTDSMLGGILDADPDDDPPPGSGYMLYVNCRITFTAAYGAHTCGKVFRRPWRIPASALTAPAD